ncbi:MAG: VOC family protein [Jatrophihabitans sp.]
MSRMIFVNLPVKDLDASVAFFTELGFTFNPQFTDERATCMVVSEQACVMLLTEGFFRTFSNKKTADTNTHCESILCVSADSREDVDNLVNTAIAAGGKPTKDKVVDGPMYGWSFQDIDGHLWEVMYMNSSALA